MTLSEGRKDELVDALTVAQERYEKCFGVKLSDEEIEEMFEWAEKSAKRELFLKHFTSITYKDRDFLSLWLKQRKALDDIEKEQLGVADEKPKPASKRKKNSGAKPKGDPVGANAEGDDGQAGQAQPEQTAA